MHAMLFHQLVSRPRMRIAAKRVILFRLKVMRGILQNDLEDNAILFTPSSPFKASPDSLAPYQE